MSGCPSCPRSRSPHAGWMRRCGASTSSRRWRRGINALKTFDPPLHAIEGAAVDRRAARCGKHLVVDVAGDLHVLIHLMSAGRLQLYDKRASLRDRTSRLLVRLADGRELRLREFGTKQAAWVKVLRDGRTSRPTTRSRRSGPRRGPTRRRCGPGGAAGAPRPLHALLRDQRVIAGIGRSWVDEILWTGEAVAVQARRRPHRRGGRRALRGAIVETLDGAIEHYEERRPAADPRQAADAAARSIATRASRARAAARRSRPSTTRTT